ncbi:MAG: hypothetical protein ACFNOP_07155 [Bacteroides sp.]
MAALAFGLAFTAASASAKSAAPACGAMQTFDEGDGEGGNKNKKLESEEKRADIVEITNIPENSTVTVDKDWITIKTPDGKVKKIRTPR